MTYSLSRKQLDRIRKGFPVSVALPPEPAAIDTPPGSYGLFRWACGAIHLPQRSQIASVYLKTIWLDCVNPLGGLTEFYGGIVPDIATHSNLGLPPIPVSVVVCVITPIGYTGPSADRIQWPGSYTSPSGYGYGGTHETHYNPVSVV